MREGSGGAGQTRGGLTGAKMGCFGAQPATGTSATRVSEMIIFTLTFPPPTEYRGIPRSTGRREQRERRCGNGLLISELSSKAQLEELEAFVLVDRVQVGVADRHVEIELAVAPAELELLLKSFGCADQIVTLVAIENREHRVEV